MGLPGVIAVATAACGILEEIPPKPASNWTVAEAQAFDEFQLYWLGYSYQGLSLTSVKGSTDGDAVKHARFSYGEPSYFGDAASGSWLSPLEIDTQPYCGWSPEEFRSHYDDAESVQVRSVSGYVQRYD